MKVFWLFNHPAPYKIDFFNELGKYVDLNVLFERANEAGRNKIFYSEKPLNFTAEIANSLKLGGVDNWTRRPVSIIKNEPYDLYVINGWMTLSERHTIDYLQKKKIPYIFYINGGLIKEKENPLKKAIKTHYISGAALYFCPDENSKRYLIHYGAKENRIILYPYSSIFEREILQKPYDHTQKKNLREHLKLEGEKIFISSGQFIKRKNFSKLISLWSQLDKNLTLLIVGEGPKKKEYEKEIADLGLTNIHILPYRPHDELFRLYRACDGFIFLSKEDIYGHVINEALSQGLPVVSSKNVNAARHLIKDGYNGYLVDLDDEEGIKKAIASCCSSLGENAISTAKENTLEIMGEFHAKMFEEIYQKKIEK